MKSIIKKMLKTLLVFIASTIIIYLVLTIRLFYKTCNEYQFVLFRNGGYDILNYLDSEKIEELGDVIGTFAELLEQDLEESNYEEDSNVHSIAEFYDPLGYSVWVHIQGKLSHITTWYINISFVSGVSIAIAYAVITSKKMNNILKFIIGYFLPMIIIPPIYLYSWTYRFWDILETYSEMPKYFYIGYTLIFVIMYLINYRIGLKMTKELNQAVKEREV